MTAPVPEFYMQIQNPEAFHHVLTTASPARPPSSSSSPPIVCMLQSPTQAFLRRTYSSVIAQSPIASTKNMPDETTQPIEKEREDGSGSISPRSPVPIRTPLPCRSAFEFVHTVRAKKIGHTLLVRREEEEEEVEAEGDKDKENRPPQQQQQGGGGGGEGRGTEQILFRRFDIKFQGMDPSKGQLGAEFHRVTSIRAFESTPIFSAASPLEPITTTTTTTPPPAKRQRKQPPMLAIVYTSKALTTNELRARIDEWNRESGRAAADRLVLLDVKGVKGPRNLDPHGYQAILLEAREEAQRVRHFAWRWSPPMPPPPSSSEDRLHHIRMAETLLRQSATATHYHATAQATTTRNGGNTKKRPTAPLKAPPPKPAPPPPPHMDARAKRLIDTVSALLKEQSDFVLRIKGIIDSKPTGPIATPPRPPS